MGKSINDDHLFSSPYAGGDQWESGPYEPEAVPAFFVPMGIWVRAATPEDAIGTIHEILDGLENVDTGEAGHIKGSFMLPESYRAYRPEKEV